MAKLGKREITRRLLQRYPKRRDEPLGRYLNDHRPHGTLIVGESRKAA